MIVHIVEDESLAAERLVDLLQQYDENIRADAIHDSVEDAVRYLRVNRDKPELIFLDIQLADGTSFEIFRQIDVRIPVIFVTAYDQYAIDAFRLFSIDYLLKPITYERLEQAMNKFHEVRANWKPLPTEVIDRLMNVTTWKERFLVKTGNRMFFRQADAIDHFYAQDKFCYLVDMPEGNKFLIDHTLDELEKVLNPEQFFRINRSVILNINAIEEIRKRESNKLWIRTKHASPAAMSVSRARSGNFCSWLET